MNITAPHLFSGLLVVCCCACHFLGADHCHAMPPRHTQIDAPKQIDTPAEHSRAEAQRDSHQARYETPQAVMADLQARALANKKELLRFRQSNLQVRSPIDGIVLSGSLDRRENYPVTKGQVLYEVAPLERLRVEVAVPAEEVTHVEVGDRVTLFLDGMGSKTAEGTIDKIRPRAEVRDQRNVFVAEVILGNSDRTLRPGMQGTAKVSTDSKRIAWILFHHAAEKARAAWLF